MPLSLRWFLARRPWLGRPLTVVECMSQVSQSETVKVVVRCRPLNGQEQSDGREQIVRMDDKMGTCIVQQNNNERTWLVS